MTPTSYHEPAPQPSGANGYAGLTIRRVGDLNGRRPRAPHLPRPLPEAAHSSLGHRPDFSTALRELTDAWAHWRPHRRRSAWQSSPEGKAFWGNRAIELSRLTVRFRKATGRTYQEITKILDVTPGQVHHYVSLTQDLSANAREALAAGRIPFKVGRTLADLPLQRQDALLPFFLSRRVTSVHVEDVIRQAKAHLDWSAEECIEPALAIARQPAPQPEPVAAEAPPDVNLVEDIQRSALALAGKLQMLKLRPATYVEAASLRRPLDLLARELMSARVTVGHDSRPSPVDLLVESPTAVA